MAREKYLANTGLSYPPHGKGAERRAEEGEIVDDLSAQQAADFLEIGAISGPLSKDMLKEIAEAEVVDEPGDESEGAEG